MHSAPSVGNGMLNHCEQGSHTVFPFFLRTLLQEQGRTLLNTAVQRLLLGTMHSPINRYPEYMAHISEYRFLHACLQDGEGDDSPNGVVRGDENV